MKNELLSLLLQQDCCVLPHKSKDEVVGEHALAGLLQSFRTLGYELSPDTVRHLSKCSSEEVSKFYHAYYPLLQDEKGVLYPHRLFYPNFPNLENVSDLEFFLRAIAHYCTAEEDSYGFCNQDLEGLPLYRPRRGSHDKVTALSGIRMSEARKRLVHLAVTSFEGNRAINGNLADDLREVFRAYGRHIQIERIPFHENIPLYIYCRGGVKKLTEEMLSFVREPTDVLRLYASMSNQGATLCGRYITFKSLSRKLRRILLSKLEEFAAKKASICEDLARHEGIWKRALEKLHPGEFTKQFPHFAKAAHDFRNGNYDTFYAKLERAKADQDDYLNLLSSRPGEFARRLDMMLCIPNYDPDKTLSRFEEVGEQIATTVLISMWNHFASRGQTERRIFRFHSDAGFKIVLSDNAERALDEGLRKRAIACIETILRRIYAKRPRVENVYLSPSLAQYAVPSNNRNASRASASLTFGSRLRLDPEVQFLRCFTYWKNNGRRVDIDLSAEFFDSDFLHASSVSWHDHEESQELGCYHSGDFVTAPRGASEFIDIDIQKAAKKYRYVAIADALFTGGDFASIPVCFAGVAFLDKLQAGEEGKRSGKLDPRSVRYKYDLTSPGCVLTLAFTVDLWEKQLIWMDAPFVGGRGMVASSDSRVKAQVQYALKRRMTLYDLFKLHDGHVSFVAKPSRADYWIGDERRADLSPQQMGDIVADWL